jgi:hypothetical protein
VIAEMRARYRWLMLGIARSTAPWLEYRSLFGAGAASPGELEVSFPLGERFAGRIGARFFFSGVPG